MSVGCDLLFIFFVVKSPAPCYLSPCISLFKLVCLSPGQSYYIHTLLTITIISVTKIDAKEGEKVYALHYFHILCCQWAITNDFSIHFDKVKSILFQISIQETKCELDNLFFPLLCRTAVINFVDVIVLLAIGFFSLSHCFRNLSALVYRNWLYLWLVL